MRLRRNCLIVPLIIIVSVLAAFGCGRRPLVPTLSNNRFSSPEKKQAFSRMETQLKSYLGSPYRYGGTSRNGLDCSGLVWAVYRDAAGIILPRQVRKLQRVGVSVNNGRWKFGDLLFFATTGRNITHVGIYIGGKRFEHVSESSGTIISSLNESYFKKRFRGARRIIR